MSDSIVLILLGIILIPLGTRNLNGDISTIHWYNRTRITEATQKQYGRCMGIGTLVIAVGIIFTGVLTIFTDHIVVYVITLIGAIPGIGIMIYGQFKYNKGLF